MEMPTPCEKCDEVFDLHDGASSPRQPSIIICARCASLEQAEMEAEEEHEELEAQIEDAEYTLKMARMRLAEIEKNYPHLAACPAPAGAESEDR